ncbi:MAG: ABC transporter substrate-binding protein [Rhizobacter sp.]
MSSSHKAASGAQGLRRSLQDSGLWLLILLVISITLTLLVSFSAQAAHAVAMFGEPKYPPNFAHFDYVRPDAPKQGQINLSVVVTDSSIDKFNPFTLRGKPAPGLMDLLFETLTIYNLDEPNTQYGLLAQDINVAPDFSSVVFKLNPLARFSNGDPVTAKDVKYSFEILTSKQASPVFRSYFSEVRKLDVVDELTVRFEFKRKGRDLSFIVGSLPVFSPKWGLEPDGKRIEFDKLRLVPPIASGPYQVSLSPKGKNVIYTRNPHYWGQNIPSRKGSFNFDRVVYKLYKDADTQVAAMRAGDFDYFSETRMRYWCCQFIGKRFDSGEIVKSKFVHYNPRPMNGFVFNLRRERFQDVRVRKALNLAFDWDWVNRMIFDDEFSRQSSYFSNTPLAASGSPSEAELKLLEPFRAELDPAVFGPIFQQPKTNAPSSIRQNLTEAVALFSAAGWNIVDGQMRNAKGEVFTLELPTRNTLYDVFIYNLSKLGIEVRTRITDPVVDRQKLRNFDFDLGSLSFRDARNPGAELLRNFDSKDADVKGSENVAGLKSKAVDALIQALLNADSKEAQTAAAHALDRVLIHGHYVLPYRYLNNHYLMSHRRLKRPDVLPLYYGGNEWALGQWWDSQPVEGPSDTATASVR